MMGKKDFGIWKRKPDWVGERAGMALVNANVYYGNFRGKLKTDEFPSQYNEQFRQDVSQKYAGGYLPVLPREMAFFWRKVFQSKTDQI
jgi:hypothetical protein